MEEDDFLGIFGDLGTAVIGLTLGMSMLKEGIGSLKSGFDELTSSYDSLTRINESLASIQEEYATSIQESAVAAKSAMEVISKFKLAGIDDLNSEMIDLGAVMMYTGQNIDKLVGTTVDLLVYGAGNQETIQSFTSKLAESQLQYGTSVERMLDAVNALDRATIGQLGLVGTLPAVSELIADMTAKLGESSAELVGNTIGRLASFKVDELAYFFPDLYRLIADLQSGAITTFEQFSPRLTSVADQVVGEFNRMADADPLQREVMLKLFGNDLPLILNQFANLSREARILTDEEIARNAAINEGFTTFAQIREEAMNAFYLAFVEMQRDGTLATFVEAMHELSGLFKTLATLALPILNDILSRIHETVVRELSSPDVAQIHARNLVEMVAGFIDYIPMTGALTSDLREYAEGEDFRDVVSTAVARLFDTAMTPEYLLGPQESRVLGILTEEQLLNAFGANTMRDAVRNFQEELGGMLTLPEAQEEATRVVNEAFGTNLIAERTELINLLSTALTFEEINDITRDQYSLLVNMLIQLSGSNELANQLITKFEEWSSMYQQTKTEEALSRGREG